MKTGKTLTELAAELERQRGAKLDIRGNTSLMSIKSNGVSHLDLGDHGSFRIQDTAHEQIAARLDIPKKYYDRMRSEAPALLDSNVNHWFQTTDEKRLIRTLDGKARAFLSNKYRPLDNFELAEVALPILMESGCNVESSEITERRMYLKVVTPRLEYDIKPGDTVQAGLVISNSEIGNGALSIEPLLFRLVCANGLIVNDAKMRKFHVGRAGEDFDGVKEFFRDETMIADDRAFWLKVQDTLKHAFSTIGFESFVESFRAATEDKIEQEPVKLLEAVGKKYSLQESEKTGILHALIRGDDMTRYGLVNAITEHAQTVDSYDRSTELERLGGLVVDLPRSDWQVLSQAA